MRPRSHPLLRALAALALLTALAACSSTVPPATVSLGDAPTPSSRAARPTATPTATPPRDGPVTASMAALALDGERHAALGDPTAPITMIEFSDYGCPFCRLYAASGWNEIKTRYIDTGQVYYVFKDFPITELHPQARLAAQAAECAGAQDQYWPMHKQLFAAQREWDGNSAETATASFERYAAALELDLAAFGECLRAGRFADEVERDYAEAVGLGLSATPAFIINGKLMSGARPTEQFILVLDRELQSQN